MKQAGKAMGQNLSKAFMFKKGRESKSVVEAVDAETSMLRPGGRLCVFGHHAKDEVALTNDWHTKEIAALNITHYSSGNSQKDLQDAAKPLGKGQISQRSLVTQIRVRGSRGSPEVSRAETLRPDKSDRRAVLNSRGTR
jgi:hypothetical protein